LVKIEFNFWKMHGLGNDFIVVDNRRGVIPDEHLERVAMKVCRRRFSVGADGLLLVYDSNVADAKMRIFNADGTEAEMCGNGIRCVAKYCYENKICRKDKIAVETLAGIKNLKLNVESGRVNSVTVDMGKPSFNKRDVPMVGEGECIDEEVRFGDETYRVTCLSMGNPHCVIFVSDVDTFPVGTVGPKIERSRIFPERVNVDFVEVIGRKELKARVWERGVGETLACGTGACAAVAAACRLGLSDKRCTVRLPGGDLFVEYGNTMLMTGPAVKSYEGSVKLYL